MFYRGLVLLCVTKAKQLTPGNLYEVSSPATYRQGRAIYGVRKLDGLQEIFVPAMTLLDSTVQVVGQSRGLEER
jgi:hypothetical protein